MKGSITQWSGTLGEISKCLHIIIRALILDKSLKSSQLQFLHQKKWVQRCEMMKIIRISQSFLNIISHAKYIHVHSLCGSVYLCVIPDYFRCYYIPIYTSIYSFNQHEYLLTARYSLEWSQFNLGAFMKLYLEWPTDTWVIDPKIIKFSPAIPSVAFKLG